MKSMSVLAVICLLVGCCGCASSIRSGFWHLAFFEEGSRYKKSGRVADLLSEPTLDIGFRQGQFLGRGSLQRKWIDYYDADRHGFADVPVVASEQAFFAFSLSTYYLGETLFKHSPESFRGGAGVLWWGLTYAGGVNIILGWAAVAVYDPIVHDIPVIVIGKPIGMIRNAFVPPTKSGESRASESATVILPTEESEYSIRRREFLQQVLRDDNVDLSGRDPEYKKAYRRFKELGSRGTTTSAARLHDGAPSSPTLELPDGRPVVPVPPTIRKDTPKGK